MTIAQAVSLFSLCIPAALAGSLKGGVSVEKEGLVNKAGGRSLQSKSKGKGKGKGSAVTLTFTTNQRYHHFGNWFFMVHDPDVVPPIYTPGGEPIFELNAMCEFGDPGPISELFGGLEDGVVSSEPVLAVLFGSAWATITEVSDSPDPLFGINTLDIPVDFIPDGHVVTAIAMIANSNDGCIFLNGVEVEDGGSYDMIEVDVGTELNDETCETIGGCLTFGDLDGAMAGSSLCPCGPRGNEVEEFPGEGFMNAHTGVGVRNDNLFLDLDWRTPMVSVTATFQSEVTTSIS